MGIQSSYINQMHNHAQQAGVAEHIVNAATMALLDMTSELAPHSYEHVVTDEVTHANAPDVRLPDGIELG
tara:strand:+ start:220 stop:429 length:210 start_codon:yes stop_codon:yes gene_type:complete